MQRRIEYSKGSSYQKGPFARHEDLMATFQDASYALAQQPRMMVVNPNHSLILGVILGFAIGIVLGFSIGWIAFAVSQAV